MAGNFSILGLFHYDVFKNSTFSSFSSSPRVDFSNRNMFCKRLLEMPMSEVIYLLTTFANMATSRGIDEEPFIRFVAKELYQITYVNKELREQLSKTGRELLYTVTACHPFTFSHLLMELEQTMESVGNVRGFSSLINLLTSICPMTML